MLSKLEVTAICFATIFIAMTSCTPINKTEDSEVRKCKPDLCDVVRCMSPESCNGTVIPPKGPCECCAKCIKLKEEGETCDTDNDSNIADSTTATTAKAAETTSTLQPSNEKVTQKLASCKSGLTCLMGTCVVLL